MKLKYERPETELVPVTTMNFFCTGGPQQVTQSDKGMQSYDFGEEW